MSWESVCLAFFEKFWRVESFEKALSKRTTYARSWANCVTPGSVGRRKDSCFPRLDASNECQYVTRSVMRQISRNLVVFMSASPCTSNYETGSYVVRVKVMCYY